MGPGGTPACVPLCLPPSPHFTCQEEGPDGHGGCLPSMPPHLPFLYVEAGRRRREGLPIQDQPFPYSMTPACLPLLETGGRRRSFPFLATSPFIYLPFTMPWEEEEEEEEKFAWLPMEEACRGGGGGGGFYWRRRRASCHAMQARTIPMTGHCGICGVCTFGNIYYTIHLPAFLLCHALYTLCPSLHFT